jgi:predicted double-glycine peptidase
MAMAFFGVESSAYEIAKRAATTEEFGTGHEGMVRVVRECGFYCYRTYDGSLPTLASFITQGIPVVVLLLMPEFESQGYGILDQLHYVVVTGVTAHSVVVHDPDSDTGSPEVVMPIAMFLERWRSIDSADEHWMMAISPQPIGHPKELAPIEHYEAVSI